MPLPGQEQEQPELLDEKCPECESQLQKRRGRFGPFVGCSNYPECKYIQKKTAKKTGVKCPKCTESACKRCKKDEVGELVERSGKKGVFYGCNHYPACRHTQNEDPNAAAPDAPVPAEAAAVTSAD
ncbi:MAG TPA: topoisomerase DNA-binding C4 zinc finger domain-containing protein [Actinomycetota bacterium]|nr:topoisomerase DNA-binding C4 zinc finger domain-containing protein [Actinomycetota bacterium]